MLGSRPPGRLFQFVCTRRPDIHRAGACPKTPDKPRCPLVRLDEHPVMVALDLVQTVTNRLKKIVVRCDDAAVRIEFDHGLRLVDRLQLTFIIGIAQPLHRDVGT